MSAENEQLQKQLDHLGPYLHPDRWDGHTFGQGELIEEQRWTTTPWTLRRLVKHELADYLNGPPDGRFALQTYRAGDTFNMENYDTGTIVAFHEETIGNVYVDNDIDLEGVAPAPINDSLPSGKIFKPPTTIQAQFGPLANIHYTQGAYWGVVARRSKMAPASLVSVSARRVRYDASQAIVTGVGSHHVGAFALGAVHHWRGSGNEWITRINRLEVCSNGTPEKARHPTFDLFRRFATHSGMA